MKLRLLFSALLIISGATTIAMDAPLSDQEIDVNLNTVCPDALCLKCHKFAENISPQDRCLTSCCRQFICVKDAQDILDAGNNQQQTKQYINQQLGSLRLRLTPEQLRRMYKIAKPKVDHAGMCLNCNQKLSVDFNKGVFLKTPVVKKPKITFIDSLHQQFELNPELSGTIMKCETLQINEDGLINRFKDDPTTITPIDFSGIKDKTCLKQALIIKLAELIKDPVKETSRIPRNLELFECAHYLGAPHNILYLIANELWPLMQEHAPDNEQTKEYKKNIKKLATPFFASPKQLSSYVLTHPNIYDAFNPSPYSHFYRGDLSCNSILRLPNQGWYQDSNKNWYKVYPFCTLDGIENFRPLNNTPIRLTGHRLERIVSNILEGVNSPNDDTNIFINFDLANNPITCIDESFFQALSKRRALGHEIAISLLNTHLTAQQKEEYKKKFDQATQTFPQRYLSNFKFKSLAIGAGFIGTALAIEYFSHKVPKLINTTSTASSAIVGGFIGGMIAGVALQSPPTGLISGLCSAVVSGISCYNYINDSSKSFTIPTHILAAPFAAYAAYELANRAALPLAKHSHPDIKRGTWSVDDFVWKNNYKITL